MESVEVFPEERRHRGDGSGLHEQVFGQELHLLLQLGDEGFGVDHDLLPTFFPAVAGTADCSDRPRCRFSSHDSDTLARWPGVMSGISA